MLKTIKCPHCGYEFNIDMQREVAQRKPVTFRFMGIHKNIGPKPKYIQVTCKNKSCRRHFQIKA